MSNNKSVIATVDSRARAESVVASLQTIGIAPSDISAVFPDQSGTRDFAHEQNTKAPEGAIAGAAGGGVLGGTLGLLAGIGALAIPGLGPFIAAGPLMAALSGAAAGGAVGGMVGALIGLGIPEVEAKKYEGKLRSGAIVLAVHVHDREQQKRAEEVLRREGASDISSTSEASVPDSDKRLQSHG
jgi:hypothetical protein